jgi:histone deacetylase 1/2
MTNHDLDVTTPQFGSSLNQAFTLKLDRGNFTLWKKMVSTIIRGHRLDGYITGAFPCPPEEVLVKVSAAEAGKQVVMKYVYNPEYGQWVVNDNLLMGWLYGSMTEAVGTEVMNCNTSASLWRALEVLYGAHSKAKVDDTRTLIQTTRKGELSMVDYLHKMKAWADVLALAGSPYSDNLLTASILSGLDAEYMSIIVAIESQAAITWQELQDKLLSYDSKLERINSLNGVTKALHNMVMPTANYAAKPSNQQEGQNRGGRHRGRGAFRGNRTRGRGRFNNFSNPRPTCQVCGRTGHTAAYCYNRFDESYMGQIPGSNSSNPNNNNNNHSALVATPDVTDCDSWIFDSGASDHVTGNVGNLAHKTPYGGKKHLVVGNGNSLHIAHIGDNNFISHYKDHVLLKNILHVPDITKNLLSISKLTTNNNVFVEFYADVCYVKDKLTRTVIMQGMLKDGLYQLQHTSHSSKSKFSDSINKLKSNPFGGYAAASSSSSSSRIRVNKSDVWHRRLGHPSSKIVSQILCSINEKSISSEPQHFCEACQFGKSHSLPFKNSESRATHVLDLIHTDVWGPSPIQSTNKSKFYIHFVDDHSQFAWIYPLKQKSEAFSTFIQFKKISKKQV